MAAKDRILVVDDEPSIRKYLQTLLEVDGFQVETVSSGKEALNKVKKGERPDFIILDVLMPEMNGIDTLRELMEIDRTLNVIMLSCSKDRKSTRLNSSHRCISYAVFCLKKKKKIQVHCSQILIKSQ